MNAKAANMNSFYSNLKLSKSYNTTIIKDDGGMPNEMLQVCLTFFWLPLQERILRGNYNDVGDFNLSVEIFRAVAVVQLLYDRKYSNGTSYRFDVIKQVRVYSSQYYCQYYIE